MLVSRDESTMTDNSANKQEKPLYPWKITYRREAVYDGEFFVEASSPASAELHFYEHFARLKADDFHRQAAELDLKKLKIREIGMHESYRRRLPMTKDSPLKHDEQKSCFQKAN
jgi:hypothetical protein